MISSQLDQVCDMKIHTFWKVALNVIYLYAHLQVSFGEANELYDD